MASTGTIEGAVTDEGIALLRRRIGFTNPTVRLGILSKPKNVTASADAIRQWAEGIGDTNPFYNDEAYATATRWGGPVAPPGFEASMGIARHPVMADAEEDARTRKALRGVGLFHAGSEHFYYRPVTPGTVLYRSQWLADVAEKAGDFAGRAVMATNAQSWWNQDDIVVATGSNWYFHGERRRRSAGEKNGADIAPFYSDEQLEEIERTYDAEYIRGADTLYLEDVSETTTLPTMVRGPLTLTDLINYNMAQGWAGYGCPPHRLARENRKRLRGFYSRNDVNAWDTVQRVHWDPAVPGDAPSRRLYDYGAMRYAMLCNYLSNFAGDDSWVFFVRYELRKFNYMGDTTWLNADIVDARVDEHLGPLIDLQVRGVNQRGQENITASATILIPSRKHGPVRLPEPPPMTPHRS